MYGSSEAFLQQAHRNNWQHYLDSLKQQQARKGWDVCVLTASNEQQAAVYQRQLDWRREAGLLPTQTHFMVIADPDGRRIGSGGATLRILDILTPEKVTRQRTLIIHSGGDSRRLPVYSATGKLFARVPRILPDGRASTIFDEFLIGLSGLAFELPPGVLVASGDVLLIFDHLQLSFQRPGVIGVAAAASIEMGSRHGVFVSEGESHAIQAYLHKPPPEELARWNAISADNTVQIDTGLVWLNALTAKNFTELARDETVMAVGLNLYGDLLLPLSQSTSLASYLADTSDGSITPAVESARRLIWDHLRGTPLTVESLQPAVFIHFGTLYEYWHMIAADRPLARLCGWVPHAFAWLPETAQPAKERLVLINGAIDGSVEPGEGTALVVDSRLTGQLAWQGAALLVNVDTSQAVELARDLALHQIPVDEGFVTRILGLYDDPKRAWDEPSTTFLNRSLKEWLADMDLPAEMVWPEIETDRRTLWNARLYPVTSDREESLSLTLALQDPARASAGWRARWLAAPRLSLAESFARADAEGILADLMTIEDYVAVRHFCAAVEAEQPAIQAGKLLGAVHDARKRRCGQVDRWLQERADRILQLRGYQALAKAMGETKWEDLAFQTLARTIALNFKPAPSAGELRMESVRVGAAARIDFGGGWTDTPPYSLERGGTVLNAAITLRDQYPIVAEAQWLSEPKLVLHSGDIEATFEPKHLGEVLDYANPADPFALLKAALVLRGIIPMDEDPAVPISDLLQNRPGRGLQLSTHTIIPRGSGLGTSSIIAGAVLQCLAHLAGATLTQKQIFDEVLYLEQMLTTGGGWQDQVGGIVGGIKLVTTKPGLPQAIKIDPVVLAPPTRAELEQRLLLVYTGQQRLAKNLLRAVMARWMARDPEMVGILDEIARLARAMRSTLETDDLDTFGKLLREHWELNKRMDPGCTNPFIDELFDVMKPYIYGGKLAGAGGGGFALVFTQDAAASAALKKALASRYTATPVAVWLSSIPSEGIRLT